ncbi:MAG: NAD(P)H-binding protein [Catenulispora sp.]
MAVLVTGARGNIGSRVVTRLHAAGCRVRASAREVGTLRVPDGVETAELDISAPDGFDRALQDVDAVFRYATRGDTAPFLAAARAAGVRYVVLLSSPASYEAAEYRGPIGRIHRANEERLAESGLPHTVLYPSWLATNVRRDWGAAIRAGRPIELAYPASQISPIHPDDVAAVAVELLLHETHRSRMQVLSGPASMRLDEAVAEVAAALGRAIEVREIGREEALARREAWPAEEILATLLDAAAAGVGHPAQLTNSVARITGHKARELRDWVTQQRADFEA